MPTALFTVKAAITPDRGKAFNECSAALGAAARDLGAGLAIAAAG